jgi:large subunit ribosomal protein L24
MASLRIKKGDLVKVITGSHKGKTAKVLSTNAAQQTVTLEKIGIVKRHVKPSQVNPRGGTKEVHVGLPVSNVALIVDEAKGKTSRIGYAVAKDGSKVRVAKTTKKEIK